MHPSISIVDEEHLWPEYFHTLDSRVPKGKIRFSLPSHVKGEEVSVTNEYPFHLSFEIFKSASNGKEFFRGFLPISEGLDDPTQRHFSRFHIQIYLFEASSKKIYVQKHSEKVKEWISLMKSDWTKPETLGKKRDGSVNSIDQVNQFLIVCLSTNPKAKLQSRTFRYISAELEKVIPADSPPTLFPANFKHVVHVIYGREDTYQTLMKEIESRLAWGFKRRVEIVMSKLDELSTVTENEGDDTFFRFILWNKVLWLMFSQFSILSEMSKVSSEMQYLVSKRKFKRIASESTCHNPADKRLVPGPTDDFLKDLAHSVRKKEYENLYKVDVLLSLFNNQMEILLVNQQVAAAAEITLIFLCRFQKALQEGMDDGIVTPQCAHLVLFQISNLMHQRVTKTLFDNPDSKGRIKTYSVLLVLQIDYYLENLQFLAGDESDFPWDEDLVDRYVSSQQSSSRYTLHTVDGIRNMRVSYLKQAIDLAMGHDAVLRLGMLASSRMLRISAALDDVVRFLFRCPRYMFHNFLRSLNPADYKFLISVLLGLNSNESYVLIFLTASQLSPSSALFKRVVEKKFIGLSDSNPEDSPSRSFSLEHFSAIFGEPSVDLALRGGNARFVIEFGEALRPFIEHIRVVLRVERKQSKEDTMTCDSSLRCKFKVPDGASIDRVVYSVAFPCVKFNSNFIRFHKVLREREHKQQIKLQETTHWLSKRVQSVAMPPPHHLPGEPAEVSLLLKFDIPASEHDVALSKYLDRYVSVKISKVYHEKVEDVRLRVLGSSDVPGIKVGERRFLFRVSDLRFYTEKCVTLVFSVRLKDSSGLFSLGLSVENSADKECRVSKRLTHAEVSLLDYYLPFRFAFKPSQGNTFELCFDGKDLDWLEISCMEINGTSVDVGSKPLRLRAGECFKSFAKEIGVLAENTYKFWYRAGNFDECSPRMGGGYEVIEVTDATFSALGEKRSDSAPAGSTTCTLDASMRLVASRSLRKGIRVGDRVEIALDLKNTSETEKEYFVAARGSDRVLVGGKTASSVLLGPGEAVSIVFVVVPMVVGILEPPSVSISTRARSLLKSVRSIPERVYVRSGNF